MACSVLSQYITFGLNAKLSCIIVQGLQVIGKNKHCEDHVNTMSFEW